MKNRIVENFSKWNKLNEAYIDIDLRNNAEEYYTSDIINKMNSDLEGWEEEIEKVTVVKELVRVDQANITLSGDSDGKYFIKFSNGDIVEIQLESGHGTKNYCRVYLNDINKTINDSESLDLAVEILGDYGTEGIAMMPIIVWEHYRDKYNK